MVDFTISKDYEPLIKDLEKELLDRLEKIKLDMITQFRNLLINDFSQEVTCIKNETENIQQYLITLDAIFAQVNDPSITDITVIKNLLSDMLKRMNNNILGLSKLDKLAKEVEAKHTVKLVEVASFNDLESIVPEIDKLYKVMTKTFFHKKGFYKYLNNKWVHIE